MVCLSFFFPFFFNKASSSISAVTFSDIAHVPKDNFIEVKEKNTLGMGVTMVYLTIFLSCHIFALSDFSPRSYLNVNERLSRNKLSDCNETYNPQPQSSLTNTQPRE